MSILIRFLILFSLLYSCIADLCGGNCPSDSCPKCVCGIIPHLVSINAWCAKYSWDQRCCKCIVSHESAGNANALNFNVDDSYDVGLFQINQCNWDKCNGGMAPCDLNENLQCAIQIYKWSGNSFELWATAAMCGCDKKLEILDIPTEQQVEWE